MQFYRERRHIETGRNDVPPFARGDEGHRRERASGDQFARSQRFGVGARGERGAGGEGKHGCGEKKKVGEEGWRKSKMTKGNCGESVDKLGEREKFSKEKKNCSFRRSQKESERASLRANSFPLTRHGSLGGERPTMARF